MVPDNKGAAAKVFKQHQRKHLEELLPIIRLATQMPCWVLAFVWNAVGAQLVCTPLLQAFAGCHLKTCGRLD